MVDLIEKEKAVRAFQGTVLSRAWRHAIAWGVVLAACTLTYCMYVLCGLRVAAPTEGTIRGLSIDAPVMIYRDTRGIPHIRAADAHDAYFAEGFAQGSDRLFQMDLFRRYIYGQLSEIVGPIQLGTDEAMRALDVHDVVDREWRNLSKSDRGALQAFSDGVNASMRNQPLPLEFRLLLYRPRPWNPRDCLAVTIAISVSLGDTPDNVLARDALWHSLTRSQFAQLLPLSDAAYDVSASAVQSHAKPPARTIAWVKPLRHVTTVAAGSNAWAAGGAHTVSGRALLANDPHLNLSIPGVFYALEMRAPGLHVAGVTVPGIPGVVLGHNDRIAWATTNAMVSTLSVFDVDKPDPRHWKPEVFHVRFSLDATVRYYRTLHEFAMPGAGDRPTTLVRWTTYFDRLSAVSTVFALDRAGSIPEAMRALSHYAGPPQNFAIADVEGNVAYHLAGPVPNDPAWGRYVHPACDLRKTYATIPFNALPSTTSSRQATIVSANNKMYGGGYPYRLSPMFAPPYRAYRIASLLRAQERYDVAYFARMQLDARSPAEAEFAHRLARYAQTHPGILPKSAVLSLARWDGAFSPQSRVATLAHELRLDAESASVSPYDVFDGLRSSDPPEDLIDAVRDPFLNPTRAEPWGRAGAVPVFHPFGPIGFPFLNAADFPGDGDEYTIHVQTSSLAQSFRAVWDAGTWDRGGLSIPNGESGEKGSPHYDDLTKSWIRGDLQPLPFSDKAVMRAARERVLLEQ